MGSVGNPGKREAHTSERGEEEGRERNRGTGRGRKDREQEPE